MVDAVPHGWNKGPSPFSPPDRSEEVYVECCERLKGVFGGRIEGSGESSVTKWISLCSVCS